MNPGGKRARIVAAAFAAVAAVAAWAGFAVDRMAKEAWKRTWVLQAEELGVFTRRALGDREDLLVVDRLRFLGKRDDVAYALVMDPAGKALIHSDVSQTGRVYDSEYAKRAAAAKSTLVQEVPQANVVEVDVPLGEVGVLRAGFTFATVGGWESWLWVLTGLACVSACVAGLLVLKRVDKL